MSTEAKRRRLTVEEKVHILEEAQQPGVQIGDLCLRHGLATSQVYGWLEVARRAVKAALGQPPGRKGHSRRMWGGPAFVASQRCPRPAWPRRSRALPPGPAQTSSSRPETERRVRDVARYGT